MLTRTQLLEKIEELASEALLADNNTIASILFSCAVAVGANQDKALCEIMWLYDKDVLKPERTTNSRSNV